MKTRQNPNPKTDIAALVAAAKNGDQQAFTALYEATNQDVYRSVRAVLRSEELALDVQQDTFVFAFSHLEQLEDPAKFRAWVRGIAVNQAKTALRKQTPVLFSELENEDGEGLPEQADLSPDASPELSLERKETAQLVNEILDGLSAGQRAAVGMYYYEQMSIAEISEALGVNVGTVKAQLSRGRKKIEEAVHAMEKRGVKLYGLSPISFLLALMKQQSLPVQRSEAVLAKTLAKAGIAAGTKAAASAAAPAVLHATKPFFSTLLGKVAIGVAAAGVVVGGAAGFRWAKNNLFEKTAPILMVDSSEDLQNDPTAPTLPMELDVTGPTVPITRDDTAEDLVTEPVVTEPENTEPTDPAVTEPKDTEPTEPAATDPTDTEPTEPLDPELYSGTCGANLTWRFDPNSGLLTIEGSGAMDDFNETVDTPSTYKTPWLRYGDEIRSVSFPSGMTRIGENAFSRCHALTSVTIPDGVTEIGDSAFSACDALTSVTIPNSVTTVGKAAFQYTALTSVTIPGSVNHIGGHAFFMCDALTSVTISEGVTGIGRYAFYFCKNLSSVTIPSSMTAIDEWALAGIALPRVIIPDSVTSIGEMAFGVDAVGDRVNGFTVFGGENSAAQRYASENGFAFETMMSEDSFYQLLRQDERNPADVTGFSDFIPNGARCLVKVWHANAITVTEAELQQAKQTGVLSVNGTEREFTDSWETVKELAGPNFDYYDPSAVAGWIKMPGRNDGDNPWFYQILPQENGYYFLELEHIAPGRNDYLRYESTELGWVLVDADTPVDYRFGDDGEQLTLAECQRFGDFFPELDENGQLHMVKKFNGWT